MIKVIAFDLIGVLLYEKKTPLTEDEDKLERLFGPNLSDEEFIMQVKERVGTSKDVLNLAKNIIFKLYGIREKDIFHDIKERYPDTKIVIASNHVSFIREFIKKCFPDQLDDIIISAEIHMMKPNRDFFHYILNKFQIEPHELLFLDDSERNVEGAKALGIHTIKVDKNMNITNSVIEFIDQNSLTIH